MPGDPLTSPFEVVLLDDDYYEKTYERFEIRMEVPEQPLHSKIVIVSNKDQHTFTIQDTDGWFTLA